MPSKKDAKAPNAAAPAAPEKPQAVTESEGGGVSQGGSTSNSKSGGGGSTKVPPHKPAKKDEPESKTKTHWIAIELLGPDGKPVAGEEYIVTTPDNKQSKGTLGTNGKARVLDLPEGTCKIEFPKLHKASWEKKSSK